METSTLDRMIIERIADLDAATNRMWQIEAKMADAIDEVKREWAEDNGWVCCDESWLDDGECSVGKPEWRFSETHWKAWFSLFWQHGQDEAGEVGTDSFWLTRLCGEGSSTLGFRFYQGAIGNTPWKKFLRQKTDALQGTRFVFDDAPSFFLPFSIKKSALASAVEEEDYASCLGPMRDALDHIRDHVDRFEALLAELPKDAA